MKPNNVEKTFETANDIILADKELEALVRKLVEKTKRRGFSKNAIMRAANLLECSTYRERNNQIGGHKA